MPIVYADVLLPLPLPGTFTYIVTENLQQSVRVGARVEVPFGHKRLFAGIVFRLHHEKPGFESVKPVLSVVDVSSIVDQSMMQFWMWMAGYYACTPGEVMAVALPAGLRLSSETSIVINDVLDEESYPHLSDEAYLLHEALQIQHEISYHDAVRILEGKRVQASIGELLQAGLARLKEELKEKYKPLKANFVKLAEPYQTNQEKVKEAFEKVSRSAYQTDALMALIQTRSDEPVLQTKLYVRPGINASTIKSLEKKGIIDIFEDTVSRVSFFKGQLSVLKQLTDYQLEALREIRKGFEQFDVMLLHGVTGSGKTHIYAALIDKVIHEDQGQVLYLVPEIALTTQLISRLEKYFGKKIGVYHSRMSQAERTELWQRAGNDLSIILAPRSGLFLPFSNLQLIIVDEEHDSSYKQSDTNPRYHGRDAAIYRAKMCGAKVLLGTATPCLETYYNVLKSKYGKVDLPMRYQGIEMPVIKTVHTRARDSREYHEGELSHELEKGIETAIDRGEQVIIFRNRRGYAPVLKCTQCEWSSVCKQCDVPLTYHKPRNEIRCHYCGYHEVVPNNCPACHSKAIRFMGFGTQKLEEFLKLRFPDVAIGRLDFDAASTKGQFEKVITDFETRKTTILIGTQMITKGLDFDNVGLVGVVHADQMLFFPDFRSHERAFQTILQVSGRAGRKHKRGLVLIQTSMPDSRFFSYVLAADIDGFYAEELQQRKEHMYPPFLRLISIETRDSDFNTSKKLAGLFANLLGKERNISVAGPSQPSVSRIRNQYIHQVLLRVPLASQSTMQLKSNLLNYKAELLNSKEFRKSRINIDVDPY